MLVCTSMVIGQPCVLDGLCDHGIGLIIPWMGRLVS